jgi:DNA-binding transcriptional regulator YhcF (GntR family)
MRQYEKVLETIRTAVLNGGIKSGDKLPSIRGLSEQLHLSNASVIKAYQVLEASHSVYVIPKSGYYWMEQPPEIANEMAYIVSAY